VASERSAAARSGKRKKRRGAKQPAAPAAEDAELLKSLRAWRLREARKKGVPAFRILTDRALHGIAGASPRDEAALLAVAGVGPAVARKYGAEIVAIVKGR
jgi:DNA topoisomerase-3